LDHVRDVSEMVGSAAVASHSAGLQMRGISTVSATDPLVQRQHRSLSSFKQ
jgi:hypothetical protein